MSGQDDEAPDPRHQQGRSTGVGLVLVLACVVLLTCILASGVGFVFSRKARRTEQMARMEAQCAMAAREARAADEALIAAPSDEQEPLQAVPLELAGVSLKSAEALSGQTVLVTLDLCDNDDGRGEFKVHSNHGPDSDGDEVERSVWVPKGVSVGTKESVRRTLTVIHHPTAVGESGTVFPAYTEIRVVLEP